MKVGFKQSISLCYQREGKKNSCFVLYFHLMFRSISIDKDFKTMNLCIHLKKKSSNIKLMNKYLPEKKIKVIWYKILIFHVLQAKQTK